MKTTCIHCRKEIEFGSEYCNHCGKKQGYGGNSGGAGKRAIVVLLTLVILGSAVWYLTRNPDNPGSLSQKPTSTPVIAKATSVPATARPSLPMPKNGDVTEYTGKSHEAPFEITTPAGSEYYYIVLVDSENTKEKIISLMVHPGRTVEISVPLGNYKMYYATGQRWYGKKDLFGEETRFYKAEDVLQFYIMGNQILGHTIELIKQVGGNLETTNVREDDFPI